MKDYSQNGEQSQFLKYFGDFRGTVLDIGANDGITFSNSRALIELGWDAVLVEPAPIAFEKLSTEADFFPCTRPVTGKLICINAAITTQDGPIDFYDSGTHLKQGDTSLLSTTKPEELARWKKSGEQFTKTTVRGITFETLLRECGVEKFEFITIDCEGADLDVLRQIDLTKVGCSLLCVEVNQRGDAEFTEYARRHGMHLVWSNYENRIFAR